MFEAGNVENLRQVTGLYSDTHRLSLWRITLVTHYVGLLAWLPTNLAALCLNGFLIFSNLHHHHVLKLIFWSIIFFPSISDCGDLMQCGVCLTWLQIHFFAYRLSRVAEHLKQHVTQLFAGHVIDLSRDWQTIKRDFTAQRHTMNTLCGVIFGLLAAGSLFWIYFITHLRESSHTSIIIGVVVMILPGILGTLCSVGFNAPRIVTTRQRYVAALHRLQVIDHRYLSLSETIKFKKFILKSIQLETNTSPELTVSCGPFFQFTYHVIAELCLELTTVYLLFTRMIDQLINQIAF